MRWLFLVIGWTAGIAAWTASQPGSTHFATPSPAPLAPNTAEPRFSRHDLHAGTPGAHAATITTSPQGKAHAFWFAGSREGAGDVQIFTARFDNGSWSTPEPIRSVAQTIRDQWRFIRKLGNPVAHFDRLGRLHLFFVSVSLGGWATSQINHSYSDDDGQNWSRSRVLHLSPFFNISTLARTLPVDYEDGSLGLPVYHENARKFPEFLHLSREGKILNKSRMSPRTRLLQPAVVVQSPKEAIALLRDSGSLRKLHFQQTKDGGLHWSQPIALEPNNADSSVAMIRLADGRYLMAYNPRTDGRSELALALSKDGQSWTRTKLIEFEAGGEFSYPTLAIDKTGDLHLVYTWQRKHIRHITFNLSWLANGATQ